MNTLRTIGIFILAGLAEIGGVYLIWQWIRGNKSAYLGLFGLVALFVYALLQTLQTITFGRAFAAYGGIFIALATLWGWWVDGQTPDRWDWIGVCVCLFGVAIILWAPRA